MFKVYPEELAIVLFELIDSYLLRGMFQFASNYIVKAVNSKVPPTV